MVRSLATLAVLSAIVFAADAADPRPSSKEWKEKRAAEDAKAASAAADEGKMAAVNKVITMLTDLKAKVLAEGEDEAKSYNKFACFCKDGQNEKTSAIKDGKDEKASLTTSINKLSDGRKDDDKTITGLEKDIKDTNDDMEKAEKDNSKDLATYKEEEADLSKAIDGITNAMKALKASKPSLLQLQSVSDTVRNYVAMADALGLGADTALLQQDPEVEMENYKFHSSSVIETLEKLLKTFRDKKAKSDADEVKRFQEHTMLMQEKTDTVKAKTLELEETQKARDNKIADIASNSQELSTVSAQLLDDQKYLSELYDMCKKKAETWDQRSKVRADELSALSAAITIVKGAVAEKTSKATLRFAQQGVSIRLAEVVARDEGSMEAVEAAAEEAEAPNAAPATFLQRRSVSRHQSPDAVSKLADLFRMKGDKLKSTLLTSLASQISSDTGKPKGMEKVTTLIEELIKRLKAEAAAEATQKGWCDKSMADANQKKVSTSSTIDELNDSMAELEADRKLLAEALATLATEIKDLKDAQKKADELREEEKKENENTVKEAKEGKEAVLKAIGILEKFYKSAEKEKVSLTQASVKGPADDAPDAGFDGGEAYKGSQSDNEGVMGMLEVITSDFERTIKETEKAEENAEQDHKAFTEETTASVDSKEATEKAKKKEKSDKDSKFDDDKAALKKKTDLLVSTIEELLELKKACVDTGMSYEDRVARREEEIAALRKGLCILTKFASYGPDASEYEQC